jgi:hypothetical protein
VTDEDQRLVSLARIAKRIESELTYQTELHTQLAKLTRVKFEALVKVGFTEQQAVELSKTL